MARPSVFMCKTCKGSAHSRAQMLSKEDWEICQMVVFKRSACNVTRQSLRPRDALEGLGGSLHMLENCGHRRAAFLKIIDLLRCPESFCGRGDVGIHRAVQNHLLNLLLSAPIVQRSPNVTYQFLRCLHYTIAYN